MSEARAAIAGGSRVVVKVGSSSLTTADDGLDVARLDALVDAVAGRVGRDSQVVLVSSGAIGAGLAPLSLATRPRDLATQQAAASVGQLTLAHAYAASFGRYDLAVGQVLLTSNDVVHRAHYRNAERTLTRLLALDAVPVVNENDTVATEEIRFGDNDRLAALVAHLVQADGLILLSDVPALYDGDPRAGGTRKIAEVAGESDLDGLTVGMSSSGLGTGGMMSKVAAARTAASSGIPVLVAAASDARRALADADVGTAFHAADKRLSARRFWLGYAAGPEGRLQLDEGAVAAVVGKRRSLLAAGIVGVDGDFSAGDVVDLVDPAQQVVARGVVAYDVTELPEMIGRSTHELPDEYRREVVHADDLVPIGRH
ncbi:glutamate 5-kinase [Prauserella halophila]|uniref:Glutamate 5-kinase n=1 Tax=Prauserella halophila TaxID=185641 RepID=A0ABP4GY54_9PSEU|nr:glutamate 5-kinase [Prauserella halophila]MCP2234751.1 glutamate 5-kinase [Prauserella halophila]